MSSSKALMIVCIDKGLRGLARSMAIDEGGPYRHLRMAMGSHLPPAQRGSVMGLIA